MLPKIKTILYCTELQSDAPYVFRYALSLAQQCQARIAVLHAMEPLSNFAQSLVELHISHAESEQMHAEARGQLKRKLEERLERLCSQELADDPEGRQRVSEILVLEGTPDQVILAQAEQLCADLIVMGTHRHTRVGEALLGTTAHKVLHGSQVPVLLTRIPKGYKEEGY